MLGGKTFAERQTEQKGRDYDVDISKGNYIDDSPATVKGVIYIIPIEWRHGVEHEPKPAMIDANGDKWWFFTFSYDWDGKRYAFDMCARSEQEAKDRIKRLPLARYDGQVDGGPIPLSRGGFLVPLVCWWRNIWNMTARARRHN